MTSRAICSYISLKFGKFDHIIEKPHNFIIESQLLANCVNIVAAVFCLLIMTTVEHDDTSANEYTRVKNMANDNEFT